MEGGYHTEIAGPGVGVWAGCWDSHERRWAEGVGRSEEPEVAPPCRDQDHRRWAQGAGSAEEPAIPLSYPGTDHRRWPEGTGPDKRPARAGYQVHGCDRCRSRGAEKGIA